MLYEYDAKLVKVVDGDTLDLEVDLGFNIRHEIRVRLLGVDTPETYGVKKESEEYQAGIKAKERVEELCTGKDLTVFTYKDKTGKYGRYLAQIVVDNINVGEQLIEEGLATVYPK